MDRASISIAAGALGLIALGAPAVAATAHNSQAGAWGPTSHICAPTPYFRAGGCASAAIIDDRRYPFIEGASEPYAEPYPARRPLAYPGGPLPYPTYRGE